MNKTESYKYNWLFFISAATEQGKPVVSKSDTGPIPHFPFKSSFLNAGIDSPIAVIIPRPVMATRLEAFALIDFSKINS